MPSLAACRAAAGPTPSSEVSGRASRLGRGDERSGAARRAAARLGRAARERARRRGVRSVLTRLRLSAGPGWRDGSLRRDQPPVVRLAAVVALELDARRARARRSPSASSGASSPPTQVRSSRSFGERLRARPQRRLGCAPGDDLLVDEADRVARAEAALLVVAAAGATAPVAIVVERGAQPVRVRLEARRRDRARPGRRARPAASATRPPRPPSRTAPRRARPPGSRCALFGSTITSSARRPRGCRRGSRRCSG